MNLCIVICTISRPDDLDLTLDSVMNQTVLPDSIMIVDGGIATDINKIKAQYAYPNIIYYNPKKASTGLTWSRNYAINHLPFKSDIVLFIDDDVTLDRNYIAELKAVFVAHPEISGATGFIRTMFYVKPWYTRIALAMIGTIDPYKCQACFWYPGLWRGMAMYPVFMRNNTTEVTADWLSGCNMAYRTTVLKQGYRFDETLTGYCLWEDVRFSNGLVKDGHKLLMTYTAQLVHRGELRPRVKA